MDLKLIIPIGSMAASVFFFFKAKKKGKEYLVYSVICLLIAIGSGLAMYFEK